VCEKEEKEETRKIAILDFCCSSGAGEIFRVCMSIFDSKQTLMTPMTVLKIKFLIFQRLSSFSIAQAEPFEFSPPCDLPE
jgi:hypothetical protein